MVNLWWNCSSTMVIIMEIGHMLKQKTLQIITIGYFKNVEGRWFPQLIVVIGAWWSLISFYTLKMHGFLFHHIHITLVKLKGLYHCWKFRALITKSVHVKSYLFEFRIRKHKNFKMSSMLVCSLRNSFDSFSVVQNGKKLHNTKLEQEKDSKWSTKA